MSKSSLPQIPADLAEMEVSAEIQRLSMTGFATKMTTLSTRRRELPVLLQEHLSPTWFEPWWKDARIIEQVVELLGLTAAPPPSPRLRRNARCLAATSSRPLPMRPGFAASATDSGETGERVMDEDSTSPKIQQLLDEWRRLAEQFSQIAEGQGKIAERLVALGWRHPLDLPKTPPLRLVRGGRSPRKTKAGRPGGRREGPAAEAHDDSHATDAVLVRPGAGAKVASVCRE
jgi:hypothetical protein